MLSVAFGPAKYYTDNLRENILRGIRQKLRRGEFPSKAPLGYYNDPKLRTIEPDPKTFPMVKMILELFAAGNYTLSQIKDKMFSLGLVGQRGKKTPTLSSIGHTLTNPFYYGMFKHRGELYQGSHNPMISKKLFDQTQQVLKDKYKPHKKQNDIKPFLFLGIARCGECGYAITAERHIKKSGLGFVYYRCTKKSKAKKCTQSFLREEKLAEQGVGICQKVSLPDEWRDRFLSKVDEWEREESHSSDFFAQNLRRNSTLSRQKWIVC